MDDTEFEDFWFSLKANFLGFYKTEIDKNKINSWSKILNNLKSEKRYNDIQNQILDYIYIVADDIFKNENSYYGNIFESNIKRWEKIVKKVNFLSRDNFNKYLIDLDKLKLQVRVYLKLIKDVKYYLFEELYFDNNIKNILEYTLETEQIIIYDLLENYYNLDEYILNELKIDILEINFKNLKTLKKIRLIKFM